MEQKESQYPNSMRTLQQLWRTMIDQDVELILQFRDGSMGNRLRRLDDGRYELQTQFGDIEYLETINQGVIKLAQPLWTEDTNGN